MANKYGEAALIAARMDTYGKAITPQQRWLEATKKLYPTSPDALVFRSKSGGPLLETTVLNQRLYLALEPLKLPKAGLHAAFLFYGLVNGVFFRAIQLFVTPKIARLGIVVICFPLAGLVLALLRSPVSQVAPAATCASWLVMGAGYQLMTHLAARVDAALLNGLQRIHAGS